MHSTAGRDETDCPVTAGAPATLRRMKGLLGLSLLFAVLAYSATAAATPERKVWRWSAASTARIFKATAGKDKFGHVPPPVYDNRRIDRLESINGVKCHG